MLGQTEVYVQYTPDGKIIDNKKVNQPTRSKYAEDAFINNHVSVWGSYYENGKWGFKCCKQMVKQSFCTGVEGIKAKDEMKKKNYVGDS